MMVLYVRGKYFWCFCGVLFVVLFFVSMAFPDLAVKRFMNLVYGIENEERIFIWQCKAPELLDAVLHKIHAASARGMYPARTLAGVA